MATCLEIITYALRMSKVIGIGKDPKAAEAQEGMVALQSLYDQWRAGGMFGTLTDKFLTESGTAKEGYRYLLDTGVTLTEPTTIVPNSGADYGRETGEERQPRDLALYESVTQADVQTARLYDRKEWVDLLDLELNDIAPLSGRNAYGLAACLATSGGFTAAFGAEPSQPVIALARHFLRNVMGKDGSTQDREGGTYF